MLLQATIAACFEQYILLQLQAARCWLLAAGCCWRLPLQQPAGCGLLQAAGCSRSHFRDPTLGGERVRAQRALIYSQLETCMSLHGKDVRGKD